MAATLARWSRRTMIASGAAMVAAALGVRPAKADPSSWRWAVDYGAHSDSALARTYQLLVLEPDHDRPIAPLRGPGAVLLGYVSLGEVEKTRPYYAGLLAAGALTQANPNWPDARMADLRHPAWAKVLLNSVIPGILALGYNGIFIDTTDNAEAMEQADPTGKAGMVDAAAALILAIRARFPDIAIMLNRGYAVLPRVAGAIDHVLGEAMASRWNFARGDYEPLVQSDWDWQAVRLRAAQAVNPALRVMTLDYWHSADLARVAGFYARERAAGFLPYVSTWKLDHLIEEPTG